MVYTPEFYSLCDKVSEAKDKLKVPYKSIESFCGPGGLSLGLHGAGFELTYAFDADSSAVKTHTNNLSGVAEVEDVRKLRGKDVFEKSQIDAGELALFSGGPPCQGFSKQKRGAHLGDSRNNLVLDYARLVSELEPRYFLFENVAIFGKKRGADLLRKMANSLQNYRLYSRTVNSVDFGLAQTRRRFLVVGQRYDQVPEFQFPENIIDKLLTVGDVLGGLPEPPEDFTVHPDFFNHQRSRVSEINIKRFSLVPQGGGWKDIPFELRLPCHQKVDSSKGGWPDVYGRLVWEGQCPTITGGFDSFTRGRYGHPLRDRALTPREAARLQGFPDSYHFFGNRSDVRSQIGNAVPPPLAYAIGIEILRVLLVHDGFLSQDRKNRLLLERADAIYNCNLI